MFERPTTTKFGRRKGWFSPRGRGDTTFMAKAREKSLPRGNGDLLGRMDAWTRANPGIADGREIAWRATGRFSSSCASQQDLPIHYWQLASQRLACVCVWTCQLLSAGGPRQCVWNAAPE
ncbi:hypothetical protein S40293_10955 [Stachybotrys chartarum IBT 40293]|nr:hypothetical protein S40293_10955 [Stachybotrys chartarum IBT 40293]KFA71958.1 hypothetical protein S40288_11166 [Stachybotrys chartarum IBT 40288]